MNFRAKMAGSVCQIGSYTFSSESSKLIPEVAWLLMGMSHLTVLLNEELRASKAAIKIWLSEVKSLFIDLSKKF